MAAASTPGTFSSSAGAASLLSHADDDAADSGVDTDANADTAL